MSIFDSLGEQIRRARRSRGLNQADIGQRVGRDRTRVSAFEHDLITSRMGRDRLTIFADICDALDLVPILVPSKRVSEIRALIADEVPEKARRRSRS